MSDGPDTPAFGTGPEAWRGETRRPPDVAARDEAVSALVRALRESAAAVGGDAPEAPDSPEPPLPPEERDSAAALCRLLQLSAHVIEALDGRAPVTMCVSCGTTFSKADGDPYALVRAHVTGCAEHPLAREVARLTAERERLRAAISIHRSQKADDRCIEDDDRLYEALGDGVKCDRRGRRADNIEENSIDVSG